MRDYARRVVAGKIVACRWVRLACQRHLDDLERSKAKTFPYRFDLARAERIFRFIEKLPHVKGKWADAGELLVLQPWDKFWIGCIFGWIEKASGRRRFRKAYVEVPRKNAKSTKAAAIGLYMFAADKEHGAEVYSGATSEKQAWEVFRSALQMAERTPDLQRYFGVTVNAKSLIILANGSRFEPVIGKPGDGASPSCSIVDEYHEHLDDTLYETMKTGMGSREQPLQLVITTAGSDQSSPCYLLHQDVEKMLEGTLPDDRLFAVIYTIDEGDDWKSEVALIKANPNYGVSIFPEYLKAQQDDAINSGHRQNAFLAKHLDVWVSADVAWLPKEAWNRCADPTLQLADFLGQSCCIALDLASRVDTASKVSVFPRVIDGKAHYFAFAQVYLNEFAVKNASGGHYAGWANAGQLQVTPGNVTDYNRIGDDLLADAKNFVIREVPHDPYHAAALVQFIQARPEWPREIQFVEFRQTVEKMSPVMKELEALVLEGRLHHDGHPMLGWMISNVVCHRDAKDNIFPRKQRPQNKIDAAIALLMALARAAAAPSEGPYTDPEVMVV